MIITLQKPFLNSIPSMEIAASFVAKGDKLLSEPLMA